MNGLPAIVVVRDLGAAQQIVGRTVLERVARAALSAGALPCIVVSFEPPPERLTNTPGVRWTREESVAREWAGPEFLLLETDALYDPRLIRWVMASSPEPGRARTIRIDGKPVLSKVHVGERAGNVAITSPESVPRNWVVPVRNAVERESAHEWLFAGLVKDNEGFMSRRLERPISITVTRLLWRLPVTPNMMTLVSMAVGLWGAWKMSWGSWGSQVFGSLLFWLHSVLDGCDGELARIKLQESRWGGLLDFWSDNVVHVAVFIAIGAGLQRFEGGTKPLALGIAAAAFALLSACVIGWSIAKHEGAGPLTDSAHQAGETTGATRRLIEIQDFASRRDFIYLVVAAALFGKLMWFLWAAAVGGGVFLLTLVYARYAASRTA
jgi:phosphatidylglycerophosphate synthase